MMRKKAGECTLLFAVLLVAASLHLSTAFSKGEALAKILPSFDFNRMRRCRPQAK
jgi:hypothetical protein